MQRVCTLGRLVRGCLLGLQLHLHSCGALAALLQLLLRDSRPRACAAQRPHQWGALQRSMQLYCQPYTWVHMDAT